MLIKFTSAGFALLLCLGISSQGAVITDTVTFGSRSSGAPAFTLALDKFDPSLGTLTSVTLVLEATTCGTTFIFDNESSGSGTVTLQIGSTVTATTLLGISTTVEAKPMLTGTGTVKKDSSRDGQGDFLGKDSFKISGGASASNSTTEIETGILSQFNAGAPGETFLVSIANSLFKDASTAGLCGPTSACAGSFAGRFTVAYSYTHLLVPIPEAGTAFWGLCFGLFAASRRPRARRA